MKFTTFNAYKLFKHHLHNLYTMKNESYLSQTQNSKKQDDEILNAIIIASIIGIVVVLALILYNSQNKTGFSELYFGNYTKEIIDEKIYFNYSIANHEGKNITYNIVYKYDDDILEHESKFIEDKQKHVFEKSFNSEEGIHKISVEFINNNQTYEIHFWTIEE